jgi:hypothetical protein
LWQYAKEISSQSSPKQDSLSMTPMGDRDSEYKKNGMGLIPVVNEYNDKYKQLVGDFIHPQIILIVG